MMTQCGVETLGYPSEFVRGGDFRVRVCVHTHIEVCACVHECDSVYKCVRMFHPSPHP